MSNHLKTIRSALDQIAGNDWDNEYWARKTAQETLASLAALEQAEVIRTLDREKSAAEILQYQLGWTYHRGKWVEDKAATVTLAMRQAQGEEENFQNKGTKCPECGSKLDKQIPVLLKGE